jgi:hypothetical protein
MQVQASLVRWVSEDVLLEGIVAELRISVYGKDEERGETHLRDGGPVVLPQAPRELRFALALLHKVLSEPLLASLRVADALAWGGPNRVF